MEDDAIINMDGRTVSGVITAGHKKGMVDI